MLQLQLPLSTIHYPLSTIHYHSNGTVQLFDENNVEINHDDAYVNLNICSISVDAETAAKVYVMHSIISLLIILYFSN